MKECECVGWHTKKKKASEKASESEKEIEREKRDVVCFRGEKKR